MQIGEEAGQELTKLCHPGRWEVREGCAWRYEAGEGLRCRELLSFVIIDSLRRVGAWLDTLLPSK